MIEPLQQDILRSLAALCELSPGVRFGQLLANLGFLAEDLGNYTLWGHLQRIWKSPETQEAVQSTEKAAKPAIEKVKKVVKAGVDEAKRDP